MGKLKAKSSKRKAESGKKSWEKRLSGEPAPEMVDFIESLSVDVRLYKYDIVGSIAHAKMLSEARLISKTEFKRIKGGLLEISEQIEEIIRRASCVVRDTSKSQERNTQYDILNTKYEDIHMAIESALVAKIGEAGLKLHTGRSRNDQVATDVRLWMRDEIEVMQGKVTEVQKELIKLAVMYTEDVMAGYTHLQRAQPIVIAAYLLSFVEQLERDFIRLGNCRELVNVSPLGSGAVAGSTLPIERLSTAKQLGFSSISRNSIDAASDRDFCAEFIFDCALIAAHLSRLAEDWIIYSSSEFGFVSIDDSYCTGSSMMPQKRNPDVLELIRAKTGRVYGSLVAILTILKAQPSGYNRDLQEDKVHIFAAGDTVGACLDMTGAIVSHTRFNTGKISAGLEEGFLDATALAEYLVGKGVAFREAHGIVGSLVAYCEKKNKKLAELAINEFRKYSAAIKKDVYQSVGAANVVKKYVPEGSAGPKQAKEQIKYWNKHLLRGA